MVDDRFQQQVKECESTLQSLLHEPNAAADSLAASLAARPVSSPAYKHALELSFRTTLHTLCQQPASTANSPLTALLELALASAPQLLDATLPFQLLEDAFDYTPLMHLPPLFAFLSSQSTSLASPALTQPRPRLALLKACNGLLRRLSKTEGAEWSGELLELLSRMMAVDERGGLNATGKFHTDNHTPVHQEATAAQHATDADSTVDYAFYRTLWSLQAYFADPPKLRQADSLSAFLSSLDSVLTAFERSPTSASALSGVQSTAAYFPKYLSGPRLMHLQLQDSTFRRHLLTQALIIFQYVLNPTADAALSLPSLAASSSSRPATGGSATAMSPTASASTGALSASQTNAVKDALVRVLQLLAMKVSDEGQAVDSSTDKYGEHLLNLLRDELAWMRWKQAKAPTFTRQPSSLTQPIALPNPPAKPAKRARRSKAAQGGVQLMGGDKLSVLWSEVPSNAESVRDGARKFAPEVEVKMAELLDEEDEWQQRLERWKSGQQKRDAVKKEKEESKEEEKEKDADAMDEDGAGDDEDETEPDESELMRKNKQRQWMLLRLLRRYDFPLFQKSDGRLDKVVDELKKRRQAAEKAAKEQSERSRVEEEAKESTKEAADGVEAAVAVVDEDTRALTEEVKDGGEKMEEGQDEVAQGDEAAVELERKVEPVEEAGGKEGQEPEERVEAEREEEEEDEPEEARSSRRGGSRADDDSPRAGDKRRTGAEGSDDDSGEGDKRQKVEDESEAQPVREAQQDDAAATAGGAEPTDAPAADAAVMVSEPATAVSLETDAAAAAAALSAMSTVSLPSPSSAAADDTDMQTE